MDAVERVLTEIGSRKNFPRSFTWRDSSYLVCLVTSILVNAACPRKFGIGLALGFCAILCLISTQSLYAESAKAAYRKDRLIILPRQGSAGSGLQKLHAHAGRRVLNAYHSLGDLQVVKL